MKVLRKIQRGMKMFLQFILAALVLAVLGLVIINAFVVLSTAPDIYASVEEYQADMGEYRDWPILVLGAGVIDNAYPSTILQKRLDTAEALGEMNADQSLIMSGDHREDNYNEVGVMKAYLVEAGLASERIYLDHAGYSTYDSLFRLKKVIKEDQVVLVTQRYHLHRALMLARFLGIDAVGVAVEESSSTRLERESREVAARMKDFAVCYLGYQPPMPTREYGFSLDDMSGDATNQKENLENH
ncbi:SanA/YdcF family protein [Suicoccus acidiformans]|nr:ElyC/SanA/YdcF family protein [Suicoccus acidiformans]